ncbi:hypothetical protein RB195_016582 [Necator americanus]|uniref:Uncharacterized protein n=1 Tax=Necator americanus TaxID=51031 RepID=A0ABR1C164_NECAM
MKMKIKYLYPHVGSSFGSDPSADGQNDVSSSSSSKNGLSSYEYVKTHHRERAASTCEWSGINEVSPGHSSKRDEQSAEDY